MNRKNYFDYVEEQLSILATRIEMRGKLNILDMHLHSENFYLHFFNDLFGWKLVNQNAFVANAEAIDLIDQSNKIVIQVSATATKKKIESALAKDLSSYSAYKFKFISISKDASSLKKDAFSNPHNLAFAPASDIFDIPSILKVIDALQIDSLRSIYEFIKKELGKAISPKQIETNLAAIINVLAKEDWNQTNSSFELRPFNVENKIDYNKLSKTKQIINEYKVHYGRVDNVYSEFTKQGANKSNSVLASIRGFYLVHQNNFSDDDLFVKIFECVTDRIQESVNYKTIPYDELELCVNILMVDAFIRCKIFENPEGYINVAS